MRCPSCFLLSALSWNRCHSIRCFWSAFRLPIEKGGISICIAPRYQMNSATMTQQWGLNSQVGLEPFTEVRVRVTNEGKNYGSFCINQPIREKKWGVREWWKTRYLFIQFFVLKYHNVCLRIGDGVGWDRLPLHDTLYSRHVTEPLGVSRCTKILDKMGIRNGNKNCLKKNSK